MEFINNQAVTNNEKAVRTALLLMSQLAEAIVSDGLNISASEVYQIGTGRLSLTKVYESEAKHRTANDPVYVQDEALSLASAQANKSQQLINDLRKNSGTLARLNEKNFKMTENCEVLYTSDLSKDLTAIHTKKLSNKQVELCNSIGKFQNDLESFNNILAESGQPKIKVQIPFLTIQGQPDLQRILTINFESLAEKKASAIAAAIREKELKAAQLKRLERLISKDQQDRDKLIKHYAAVDPLGKKYSDETLKNLISPDKGNFKDVKRWDNTQSLRPDNS